MTDFKAPSAGHSSQVLDRPCCSSQVSNGLLQLLEKSVSQSRVTALFYLEDSRKIHLGGVRAHGPKDAKRRAPHRAGGRERGPFGSSFYVFFLPLGPVLCKLGLGRSTVPPEVLTAVLGPSSVLFSRAFPSLSFSHHHFGLLFPILTT